MNLIAKLGPGEVLLFLIFVIIVGFKLFYPIYAITFIIIIYSLIYLRFKSINNYWKNRNVPGPEGILFFGSMLDLIKDIYKYDKNNFQKYGKYYGAMMKGCPDFATTDVEMIQKVMTTEFDSFPNQYNFILANSKLETNLFTKMLNNQTDDDWKRIRRRITPALTSIKMKQLLPDMITCIEELDQYIDGNYADKNIDVSLKDVYSKLTLSVIGRTVFAEDFNTFSTVEDTPLLANAKLVFGSNLARTSIYFSIIFPFLCQIYEKLTGKLVIKNDVNEYFLTVLNKMVDDRLSDIDAKNKYKDVVQLLLNAIADDSVDNQQLDSDLISDNVQNSSTSLTQKVSKLEIMAQMMIFLSAGFETTASTLHFITYILSQKFDIQEKMRNEIIKIFGEDTVEKITLEELNKLTYMDQVIHETLRMYSPAGRTNRICVRETTINGIIFEPGTCFSISPLAVHYNPEYYPNPEIFDPERFSKQEMRKRNPMTFLAFGGGPRVCLGMKFAEYEMKTALVMILKKYKLLPSDNMPGLPVPFITPGLLRPTVDLKCQFQRL